jgi:hypothetical protein
MEVGGRLGAHHAQASLIMLVEYAIVKGRLYPRVRHAAPPMPPLTVALWTRMCQHRLLILMHLTLSRQILRYFAPSLAAGACYS